MKELAVVDLLSDSSLKALATKIAGQLADDLIQEVALLLLEMDDEKWQEINEGGYLRWYVIRTMLNMATSNRSTFATKYETNREKCEVYDIVDVNDYDNNKDEDIAVLVSLLEEKHWYDRDILKLYLREGSYRKVSKVTNIPFKSIGNTVKKTITNIKNEYDEYIAKRSNSRNPFTNLGGDSEHRPKD